MTTYENLGVELTRRFHWHVFLAILVLGGYLRFGLPPIPAIDGDFWGYLGPAISLVSKHEFVHIYGRRFIYPLFLSACLKLFGKIEAIAVVQHFLGFFGVIFIYLSFGRLAKIQESKTKEAFLRLVSLVVVGAIFLGETQLFYAHQIRPEFFFVFIWVCFSGLAIFVFTKNPIHEKSNRPVYLLLGLVLLSAFNTALYLIRAQWILACVGNLAVGALYLFAQNTYTGIQRWGAVFLVLIVAPASLLIPEKILASKDESSLGYAAKTLFGIHLDIVLNYMNYDLEDKNTDPFPYPLVKKARDEIQHILNDVPVGGFETLKFNADYFFYNSPTFEKIEDELKSSGSSRRQFYYSYFWEAVRHDPWAYLKKIKGQLAFLVKKPGRILKQPEPDWKWPYLASKGPSESFQIEGGPLMAEYVSQLEKIEDTPELISQDRILIWKGIRTIMKRLSWLCSRFYVLFYFALIGSALVFLRPAKGKPRLEKSYRMNLLIAIWLYFQSFSIFLSTAAVHSTDIQRYIEFQQPITWVCVGFSFFTLATLYLRKWFRF